MFLIRKLFFDSTCLVEIDAAFRKRKTLHIFSTEHRPSLKAPNTRMLSVEHKHGEEWSHQLELLQLPHVPHGPLGNVGWPTCATTEISPRPGLPVLSVSSVCPLVLTVTTSSWLLNGNSCKTGLFVEDPLWVLDSVGINLNAAGCSH